ncbi:MAG: glycogen debranching protein GlgX [Geobacteraceae bacterium]|nr:glycogen debranching protein GlgX [Geobacteraceae bacterium]
MKKEDIESSGAPRNGVCNEKEPADACCAPENRLDEAQQMRFGKTHPLGATIQCGGVNFSVYSKNCTSMELLLFDTVDAPQPSRIISLKPNRNRTGHYWHAFVPDLKAGQIYAYRAYGPYEPYNGLRFDGDKVLLDPYGKAVAVPDGYSRKAACCFGKNTPTAMKSVVTDPRDYDWEGDTPLKRPFSRSVIYEMHVGGFTRNPNSGIPAEKRGTFSGLMKKLPYLKDLGVTAVEFLPIFQFDWQDSPEGLVNYWGYSPVSFFAPHHAYSSRKDPLGPMDEFRDMVKALHREGIEVILDVVFNHTAEGGHNGPTLSFKGLENSVYYILADGGASYANYTGTGNTLNANNPIVRRMIVDCLHYWVEVMHVDGFRFDLASILSRDESGCPMADPPILWDIDSDPVLAGIKLIAEAWDAAGLYQVGSFIGDSWKEWNGKFRDDVRRFMRGDNASVRNFATRLLGSPDIFGHEEREPEQSINFVTCHDGFTLNDLVSYNGKHNELNGEDNRDGYGDNLSWNCGVEGPSDDREIEMLRNRQVKNFLAITLFSLGAPMILMGDEVRRTQRGNNNAYCQDNELSWFDWTLPDRHSDIFRFCRRLIRRRLRREIPDENSVASLNQLLLSARIQWHGVQLNQPDWNDYSHSIAVTTWSHDGLVMYHLMFNAYQEVLEFQLPPLSSDSSSGWRRIMDTFLDAPNDICRWKDAVTITGLSYPVQPYSFVFLCAKLSG